MKHQTKPTDQLSQVKPVLNFVCYVSLCEGLRAAAGSLSYIVHVDCCGLSMIVIKKIIIIIIISILIGNAAIIQITAKCSHYCRLLLAKWNSVKHYIFVTCFGMLLAILDTARMLYACQRF